MKKFRLSLKTDEMQARLYLAGFIILFGLVFLFFFWTVSVHNIFSQAKDRPGINPATFAFLFYGAASQKSRLVMQKMAPDFPHREYLCYVHL